MRDLIIGYGYVGHYLSAFLLRHKIPVEAWSRTTKTTLPEYPPLIHQQIDLGRDNINITESYENIYYLIPPTKPNKTCTYNKHLHDPCLTNLFTALTKYPPKHFIYFSSSGVYGDYHGQNVDETSPLNNQSARGILRIAAEQQCSEYCNTNNIPLTILRVAGIYGPDRIPIKKAYAQQPIIIRQEAPCVNLIYVEDLAYIAAHLAKNPSSQQIYNVCDGEDYVMGDSQRYLSELLKLPAAKEISLAAFKANASPMLLEFATQSKQLNNKKLIQALPNDFTFTSLRDGIKKSHSSKLDE